MGNIANRQGFGASACAIRRRFHSGPPSDPPLRAGTACSGAAGSVEQQPATRSGQSAAPGGAAISRGAGRAASSHR
eukprot:8578979-Pyramimonas_sp.AAC.1